MYQLMYEDLPALWLPTIITLIFRRGAMQLSPSLWHTAMMPSVAGLSFAGASCFVIASGDMGAQLKFFVYAQEAGTGKYFVGELLIGKAPGTLTATIKSEASAASTDAFKAHLLSKLGAVKA